MWVMRVVGTAVQFWSDSTVWLERCDVDAHNGVGEVRLTPDRNQAQRFDSVAAVLAEWKRVSMVRPLRPDGKPNRPLSAFTIQPEPLDETAGAP